MKTRLLFILLAAAPAFGQSGTEKQGAKAFNNYDYIASIETLESVKEKDADVLRKLAESYDKMGDYATAATYYGRVCTSPDRVANDYLRYAHILMKNERYSEAELQMKNYEELNPNDAEAARYRLLSESVSRFTQMGSVFSVQNMSMNSAEEDFAPVMYQDQLYFASTRYRMKSMIRQWTGNHLSFLDICVADVEHSNVTKWWLLPDKNINKRYHEGPVAFSSDGNEMYITRNNYEGKGQDGTRNLKLLVSTKTGNVWSDPQELPFNSKEFSVGHATLSQDGNTMVFASDMPGGKGGVDLYKTTRVNGVWSTPQNLTAVNTSGNDMFPYLHPGGVLVFASDGHPGYGGLDLFVGQWKDGTVKRYQNLGAPMNSPADDFSVWIDAAQKTGYFASNRSGGKGNDDLYSFTMSKPFSFGRTVKGMAKDLSGAPLPGAKVQFADASGNILAEAVTDNSGAFVFETDKTGNFRLHGTKETYFDGTGTVNIMDETGDEVTHDVLLEKDPGFALLARITDKQTKNGLDSVKVVLINNMTGEQETVYTNAKGEIFRPIRDKKVNDRISYNIHLEKQGYVKKDQTYNRQLDREGKYVASDEISLAMDKMDVGLDLAKAIDLKPIFFDVAKFAIRPDAALELDKIVKVMNENPTMVVELGSHTDCRGTAARNQELSQKRAMASAEYIKARITKPERIYGMGYGETKLLNGCACEGKVKPKCSETEHQENRRTEFLIVRL